MKPDFKIKNVKLYNVDCMEFMKEIPDNYYELAIVDPPYGINFAKTHTGKGWTVRENKDWDKERPNQEYFNELFRVSNNQIIWGANYMTEFLPPSQGWIFWDKGQRNFSLADGELAYSSFNRALRVFTLSRGAMNAEIPNKFHPTTKPIQLYRWLLEKYAKNDWKVLDTHGGSMTIGQACMDMNFDIDIMEIDKEYFDNAVDRLKNNVQDYLDF